jgi:transaldolase
MVNDSTRQGPLDYAVVECANPRQTPERLRLTSSPLLAALARAGTEHVYVDTAAVEELRAIAVTDERALTEVDGNTVNQPLVRKVLARYTSGGAVGACEQRLRARRPDISAAELAAYLYTTVCGWIGGDAVRRVGGDRPWDVSLQLHMEPVGTAPELAKRLGRCLHAMVPSCLVKVPFRPQAPHSLLIARDLQREGIPVNFTSTFSARQAVAAGLLANVARTNIFMGRLNQGLQADLVGEHVVLEAQRAIARLRRAERLGTRLIVASMREWHTFARVAGCDAFTAPTEVLRDFLRQSEVSPLTLASRLETSYADEMRVADDVRNTLGAGRLGRLWRVEPEFVEFLIDYRASAEYRDLEDGDALRMRFDRAGFGDFFYAPTADEWSALRRSKLPDLHAPLTSRVALDTLYSLLADADFVKEQAVIDTELLTRRHGAAA